MMIVFKSDMVYQANMINKKTPVLLVTFFLVFLQMLTVVGASEARDEEVIEYTGMCDASAAIAIDSSTFVVANDEDNILRFYRHDGIEHGPIQSFDLGPFLNLDAKHPEADIEAAAQIGNRIYWITSHARNKKGKRRSSRYKFFATQVDALAGEVVVRFVGRPYEALVEDMIHAPSLHRFALRQASGLAAKHYGSLNIEGLSTAPNGALLIAFRSPVPDGKALLITLKNPQDLIIGKAARFGDAVLLPLYGLGIRAMAFMDHLNAYMIVAGAFDGRDAFKLFLWSGRSSDEPVLIKAIDLHGLHPETVVVYPHEKERVQILSDDGMRRVAGGRCKDATITARRFRSMWITVKKR